MGTMRRSAVSEQVEARVPGHRSGSRNSLRQFWKGRLRSFHITVWWMPEPIAGKYNKDGSQAMRIVERRAPAYRKDKGPNAAA